MLLWMLELGCWTFVQDWPRARRRDYFTCVGAVKSRLRRVRSTSWLIQMIARTIPSRTAASKNHGQV